MNEPDVRVLPSEQKGAAGDVPFLEMLKHALLGADSLQDITGSSGKS
jgi:hypothetical protein